MITINVQENEAWDRLSILEIKKFFSNTVEQRIELKKQIIELQEQINIAITYNKAVQIYSSEIYTELYNVNFKLFEYFNELKNKDLSGIIGDKLNYERHLIKNKLQETYFNNKNKEIKIGYKNE